MHYQMTKLNRFSMTVGLVLASHVPASAQESPPIRTAADLSVETEGLRPHRLVYNAKAGPDGAAMLADGALLKPQISITLDRTIYHLADGSVRDAIRFRWVSNTHPYTDELVVDAETLATVNERTRAGSGLQTREEILYVRDGHAIVTLVSDSDPPTTNNFALEHEHYYGIMALPYLFASMDVPAGTRFQLPAIGSDREALIDVEVHGPSTFENATGEMVTATLVTSRHSWGSIDWYVDGARMPYHLHAVWHYDGGGSVVSEVADFDAFTSDEWVDVVDRDLLKRRVGGM